MLRIIYLVLMVLAFSGCSFKEEINKEANLGVVGENKPITRAEVSKMIAYNKFSLKEINELDRVIEFEDTKIDDWYDKYINASFKAGYISGVDDLHFCPEQYLSLRQAQFLLDKLNSKSNIKLKYEIEDKDKPIPYNIWVAAFEKVMNNEKLAVKEVLIYSDSSLCKKFSDNIYATNLGITFYEGDEKIIFDEKLNAIVSSDSIVCVKEIQKINEYENLKVSDVDSESVKLETPAGVRKFNIKGSNVNVGDSINIKFENDVWTINN